MPDPNEKINDPEKSDATEAMFLDLLIRLVAIQSALLEARILTADQIEAQVELPEIRAVHAIHGPQSKAVQALLRRGLRGIH